MFSPPFSPFPSLLRMKDDGQWNSINVGTANVNLGQNGGIVHGDLAGYFAFTLRKPDDVTLDQIYNDGKFFMDLVLRGIMLSRYVGNTPIRITSLGAPQENFTFRDYYGRRWMIKTWLREYDDSKVVTFSLPTPEGVMTLMRIGQTGLVDDLFIPTMKLITNFVLFSYVGSLRDWEDFLKYRDLLPDTLASLAVSRNDEGFSYSSDRLVLKIDKQTMTLTEKSLLALMMGYGFDKGSATWDVSAVMVLDNQPNGEGVIVSRHEKPDQDMDDEFQKFWKTLAERKFPYDRVSHGSEGTTKINAIVESFDPKGATLLHSLHYSRKGTVDQKGMEKKLKSALAGLNIKETTPPSEPVNEPRKTVLLPFRDYSRVMQKDAASSLRYAFQGQVYEEMGDRKRALESVEAALSLDQFCAEAFYSRGMILIKRQELDKALTDFNRAIELNPFFAYVYNDRGDVFFKHKQFDKAIEDFNKAIELDSRLTIAYENRSSGYIKLKQYERALVDRNKALEQYPNVAKNVVARGQIHRFMGDDEKALRDADKAIELDPKILAAYTLRGEIYATKKDFDRAFVDYNKTVELDSSKAANVYNRGSIYGHLGNYEKAMVDLQQGY